MPTPFADEISRFVLEAGRESVALPLDGMHYMPDAKGPVFCGRFAQNCPEKVLLIRALLFIWVLPRVDLPLCRFVRCRVRPVTMNIWH